MHVENIHYMIETISKSSKEYVDNGIESIDLCEFEKVVDVIKDLAEAEYYSRVSVAMENSNDKKFFHDPSRTTLNIYDKWPYDEDMYIGKAYYPDGENNNKVGEFEKHMQKFLSESINHSDNTVDNKQWRTQEINKAIEGFKSDMMEMVSNSQSDEKALYKQKLTAIVNSL